MKTLLILAAVSLMAASALAQNESTGTVSDPAAAASPVADTLTAELKIGADVQDREVVGEAASFGPDTETVVAWSRISGANMPTEITHVWKRNGEEVASVPLKIQSVSYRTYSRKTVAGLPGNWTVEVRDSAGNVIATKHFTVGQTASPATGTEPAGAAPAAETGAQ